MSGMKTKEQVRYKLVVVSKQTSTVIYREYFSNPIDAQRWSEQWNNASTSYVNDQGKLRPIRAFPEEPLLFKSNIEEELVQ
jgi:hypothetical protein